MTQFLKGKDVNFAALKDNITSNFILLFLSSFLNKHKEKKDR